MTIQTYPPGAMTTGDRVMAMAKMMRPGETWQLDSYCSAVLTLWQQEGWDHESHTLEELQGRLRQMNPEVHLEKLKISWQLRRKRS